MPDSSLTHSYTKLTKFTTLGQPGIILRLEIVVDFPVHEEILRVYSSVLRDVARGTLPSQSNASGDSEDLPLSIIPLGAGDAACWDQSLTAMYCLADGLADDAAWKAILVSVQVGLLAPLHIQQTCDLMLSWSDGHSWDTP